MRSSIRTKRKISNPKATGALLLSSATLGLAMSNAPAWAKNVGPTNCGALAGFVISQAGKQLNNSPIAPPGVSISSTTPVSAAIQPASGPNLAYCKVVFQLEPAITIQVGLPLNSVDGGTGSTVV